MAFTAHDPRVFYDLVVTRLGSSTGKNIGEGEAPANKTVPYAVVYPQDETDVESSVADPHDLTIFEWLVVSVGDTADQVLWMVNKVRAALLGWQPVGGGNHVMRDGGSGLIRDDDIQAPKFSATDRFVCLFD